MISECGNAGIPWETAWFRVGTKQHFHLDLFFLGDFSTDSTTIFGRICFDFCFKHFKHIKVSAT